MQISIRSSLKPGPDRTRKIWPPQPKYRPAPAGLRTAAKGQNPKIRPDPVGSIDHAASERRLSSDDHRSNATSLPVKVLFYVKIHVQVCGFFRYLM